MSTAVGSSAVRCLREKSVGDVGVAADHEIAHLRHRRAAGPRGSARSHRRRRARAAVGVGLSSVAKVESSSRWNSVTSLRYEAITPGTRAARAGQPDRPRQTLRRRIRTETPPLDSCHVELRQRLDELPNAESRARRVEACGEGRDPGHLVTSSGAAAPSSGSRPTSSIPARAPRRRDVCRARRHPCPRSTGVKVHDHERQERREPEKLQRRVADLERAASR